MLRYTPTPIQEIFHPSLDKAGVRLLVKREDLNHPFISGNKWWKLKYNLEQATKENKKTLLTFGGAYSNHIYATAAAARELHFDSIGVIRGEETLPINATLKFASDCGMHLRYINREAYKHKHEQIFREKLQEEYGDFFLIPEGGTNKLAVQGCKEFATQYLQPIQFDYCCLAVGTGGTMAGIIAGLDTLKQVIGFPVLKGGEFLIDEIKDLLQGSKSESLTNWQIDVDYHHGGYAKTTPQLIQFIQEMKSAHQLPLDQVYTGKLLWAVMDYVRTNKFPKGSTVLAIHSGGLQGATSLL